MQEQIRAPERKTKKGEERRLALLTSAMDMFIANGYERTSLESIIKKSGGSRSTIYQCYGNKEGLFMAALQMLCDEIYTEYMSNYSHGAEVRGELRRFGEIFLHHLTTERSIGALRLIYAESVRFPKIGQWYYTEAIEKSALCFARVLENSIELPFETLLRVSEHFIGLLQARIPVKMLCLQDWKPTEQMIADEIDFCVSMAERYLTAIDRKP